MNFEGVVQLQEKHAEALSRLLGKPVARIEDRRLVRGAGKFIGNMTVRGVLYADIVRSPYAHAKIKNIDVNAALSLPGVVRVVTGIDAKEFTKPLLQTFGLSLDDYCLAPEEAVYVGQPVAAVVAESSYIAHDAASLVEVDYEPLDPVVDARSAIESPDSGARAHANLEESKIFHKTFSYGDIDSIFSTADHVISDSLVFESYSAIPLEPFGVIADYDKATNTLTVIDNSQIPSSSVTVLSNAFSIPSNHIRIIQNDIGGGFGIKTALASSEVLISLLSMRTGHPVKWIETRTEHLVSSLHGSRRTYDVSVAVKKDGTILGLKVKAIEDAGAFVRRPFTAPISCLRAFGGPYRIKGFEYDLSVVLTNKCPTGSSRGNGKNHHSFMLEKMVDRIAQQLNLDPLQLRLQNLIQPEEFPFKAINGAVYDSGNYPEALTRAAQLIGYKDFRTQRGREKDQKLGKLSGIGLSIVVDGAGSNSAQGSLYGSRVDSWGSGETVSMRMDQFGKVNIALCTSPQGQAHETIAATIAAEKLGIPIEDVLVFIGFDSVRNIGTPMSGTYSSRFASIGASAVILCANDMRKRILKIASSLLKEAEEDLDLENGTAFSRRTGESVAITRIAKAAYTGTPDEVPLSDRALVSVATYSQRYGRNAEEAKTNFAATYSYQVHAAKVEVDVETGQINISKYVVVDDSGLTLNPIVLEGQIHGGTFNGVAAGLYERFKYGDDGQLLTTTFMDYLAPTSCEIPNMEAIMMETPSPFTLSGAKGVGETGALGAQPAIMNAVEDALRAYGVRIRTSHLPPDIALELIHSIRESGLAK